MAKVPNGEEKLPKISISKNFLTYQITLCDLQSANMFTAAMLQPARPCLVTIHPVISWHINSLTWSMSLLDVPMTCILHSQAKCSCLPVTSQWTISVKFREQLIELHNWCANTAMGHPQLVVGYGQKMQLQCFIFHFPHWVIMLKIKCSGHWCTKHPSNDDTKWSTKCYIKRSR